MRLLRWAAAIAAAWLVLTAIPVLGLRWLAPSNTAFMMQRRIAAWAGTDTPVQIRYRWTDWDEIAAAMPLAVVASEDQKFPLHFGFDTEAIAEALEENAEGERLRGASTISQQVAKNLFLWPGRSFVRKGLEAYFTLLIEVLWPKRRILEMHLNIAEFGDGVYGVGAAAEAFFKTTPAKLSRHQAALLATVLPSPRRMHADRPGNYTRDRSAWVLRQMRQLGDDYLTLNGVR